MKLIEFKEQNAVFGKDQKEYNPLPAHVHQDTRGTITSCWKLNLRERIKILFTGKVWHQILTFGAPFPPQLLSTDKPEMEAK